MSSSQVHCGASEKSKRPSRAGEVRGLSIRGGYIQTSERKATCLHRTATLLSPTREALTEPLSA
eukprot:4713265-Amphidinium_carterae.1